MKRNLLRTTILATLGTATLASCLEKGVIVDREDIPEEKAFFVNVIRNNKAKQKPLKIDLSDIFEADRKLFFSDSTHMEPFVYGQIGDTIVYSNLLRMTYIETRKRQVRSINGIRNRDIVKQVRNSKQR